MHRGPDFPVIRRSGKGGVILLLGAVAAGCGASKDAPSVTHVGAPPVSTASTAQDGSPPVGTTADHGSSSTKPASSSPGKVILPPEPQFTATRQGQSVLIRYRIPKSGAKPALLATTVDSSGERYPPLTYQQSLHGRRVGVVRQPLGLGKPPYRVIVQTIARDGLRSRLVRFRL
jgi:hypothetical protein